MSLRHEYFVYDGRDCIDRFVVDDGTKEAKAFDARRKPLGTFPTFKAAATAINEAYRAATVPVAKGKCGAKHASGRLRS